jgi:hypothetical protein
VYQLPINVIIETMQGLRERVTLRASLPALPGLPRQAIAHIVVGEQGLQHCVISDAHTGETLFTQREALGILQRCGSLEWFLEPLQANTLPTGPTAERTSVLNGGTGQIPTRLMTLTPTQMQALPSACKKVFALVNSKNSVEHIAHLLSKSPQEVYRILLELKQQRLIDL